MGKEVETRVVREQAEKKKEKDAKIEKKNMEYNFQQMRNFERAVEVADEVEEKAKVKKELATKQLEQEKKKAQEKVDKERAHREGAAQVILDKRKAQVEAEERAIQKSLLLVKEQRAKKANSDCNTICVTSGQEKERLPVPLFLGCFKDSNKTGDRALTEMHVLFDDNTKEACNTECLRSSPANMGFGLQGRKCFCGAADSQYKAHGKADESQCIIPCPGAPKQACGGPLVNRVYEILIPRGTFEWSGAVFNASRLPGPQYKHFKHDGCQCKGRYATPQDELASLFEDLWE